MALAQSVIGQGPVRRPVNALLEIIVPIVLIAWWWIASVANPSFFFPPLPSILETLLAEWPERVVTDVLPTIENLFLGLFIAIVAGVGMGLVLGMVPVLSEAVAPILEFLRAIPGVALLPTALLLLGVGPTMQVSLIAYGAIWPILLNTIDGVRGIDGAVVDVVRCYQIRFIDRLFRITLRAASPQIVAGIRTALAIGITVVIFSEMMGATNGIGFQILQAQRGFAVPDMWAGIIVLGVVGYLLNLLYLGFEAVVLRWHRGMREVSR